MCQRARRTRDLLVRQRTHLINALRGHLAEHGVVAPTGAAYLNRLAAAISDDKGSRRNPFARNPGTLYLEHIRGVDRRCAVGRGRTRWESLERRLP